MNFTSDKTFLEYTGYFHDATLHDILYEGNTLVLPMNSAELVAGDMHGDLPLTNNKIQGKLYIEGIKSIIVNRVATNEKLKFQFDSAEMTDLEIEDDRIELGVEWRNRPPKLPKSDYSYIIIKAEKAYWENIPHLEDAYD